MEVAALWQQYCFRHPPHIDTSTEQEICSQSKDPLPRFPQDRLQPCLGSLLAYSRNAFESHAVLRNEQAAAQVGFVVNLHHHKDQLHSNPPTVFIQ